MPNDDMQLTRRMEDSLEASMQALDNAFLVGMVDFWRDESRAIW